MTESHLPRVASALLLLHDRERRWTPYGLDLLRRCAAGCVLADGESMMVADLAAQEIGKHALLQHALDGVNRNKLRRLIAWAAEKKRRQGKEERP